MKAFALLCFITCLVPTIQAQQFACFISTQSGSPISAAAGSEQVIWNYSLGIEKTLLDKIGIAFSWRKMFYIGDDYYGNSVYYNNLSVDYTEIYSSYAFDFESKYYFTDADDAVWYMSSGLGYQNFTMDVKATYVDNSGGLTTVTEGAYKYGFSVFPIGLKLGHRNSGDVLIFDYYIGLMKNIGIDGVQRPNEGILEYSKLKSTNFIFGMKLGIKL